MKVKTPLKAIRAYCLNCMCNSSNEVTLCPSKNCALYPYRLGHRPKESETAKTPVKTIRAKCIDCSCFIESEVRNCTFIDCPLYPYRLGHRPKINFEQINSVIQGGFSEETPTGE